MAATLFVWAWYRGRDGALLFLAPLAIAGLTYLAAVRELSRTPKIEQHVVLICLALSLSWRIPFFLIPAGPRDDLHRYVWDGRVQRLGYNPYIIIPGDPALATLHTPETRGINNPDVASPYPAGAELFFRGVAVISESTLAFRAALVACDLTLIFILFSEFRRTGRGEHWVLAYAWHPLIATEVAGGGHIDILGVLLLVLSAAALARRWRAISGIALGLAVAVKFLPIVVTPLYWRRLRVRDAMLAMLTIGLLYTPFFNKGRVPIGSLATYVERFRFNDPIFAAFETLTTPRIAAGLAVFLGLVTAVYLRKKGARPWGAMPWCMAASLACAPVVYPWYLLWLVPFLGAASTAPLMIWSVSILFTYFVWYLERFGHPWQVPSWIMVLEYVSVLAAAGVVLVQRRVAASKANNRSGVFVH